MEGKREIERKRKREEWKERVKNGRKEGRMEQRKREEEGKMENIMRGIRGKDKICKRFNSQNGSREHIGPCHTLSSHAYNVYTFILMSF